MRETDHSPSTMMYLNQLTRAELDGRAFSIHNWAAQPNHMDNLPHKHSFFEVCYVVSGEGLYLDNGQEHRLRSGALFCSRPGIQHQIYQCRSLYLIWVSFDLSKEQKAADNHVEELVRQLEQSECFFIQNAAPLPSVLIWQSLLRQASRGYGLDTILSPLADGFLAALIHDFLSPAQSEVRNFSNSDVSNSDPERVLQRARTFIQDNLAIPMRLKDVADYMHLSERSLSRLFHDSGGSTFIQYLRTERHRRAEQLLIHTDLSIKTIADQTGFESIHYFTKSFAKAYGMPPGQYRSQQQAAL